MRVLICGDRKWEDREIIATVLEGLLAIHDEITIIEGCAAGADSAACHWYAIHDQIEHEHFPADWDRYGKAAGPIRNQQMLTAKPDLVVAFHDHLDGSKGTKDMVSRAIDAAIPTYHLRRLR